MSSGLPGPTPPTIARGAARRDEPLGAAPRHVRARDRSTPSRPSRRRARRARPTGVIDQVVVTWFAAPHSYTGEDVVEISAHGSPVLLQRIVELRDGARARGWPSPASSRLRAYLNGRLDLMQAEAVADLVDAVTPLQARAAMDQLEGTLTTRDRRASTRRCSTWRRGSRRRSTFPTKGFTSSRATTPSTDSTRIARDLGALCSRAAAPAVSCARAGWS